MTNDEKAKAYEMALEAARKELGVDRKEWEVVQRVLHNIFPELRESEDERVIKALETFINQPEIADKITFEARIEWLSWLEKQKEPEKEELVYRLNGLMQEYINEAKDQEEEEHRFKCYKLFWNALEDASYFEQKEQKPAEWSEEDEKNWRLVLNEIKDCELRCWFYSVWERLTYHKPHWKPSEEQNEPEYYQHFDPDC